MRQVDFAAAKTPVYQVTANKAKEGNFSPVLFFTQEGGSKGFPWGDSGRMNIMTSYIGSVLNSRFPAILALSDQHPGAAMAGHFKPTPFLEHEHFVRLSCGCNLIAPVNRSCISNICGEEKTLASLPQEVPRYRVW